MRTSAGLLGELLPDVGKLDVEAVRKGSSTEAIQALTYGFVADLLCLPETATDQE